jgi:hypothetical protein
MKIPQDVKLIHAEGTWTLSFGRYRAVVKACECDLPTCTCKRGRARWNSRTNHEYTYCHSGHAEHVAILLRRAVRGTKR